MVGLADVIHVTFFCLDCDSSTVQQMTVGDHEFPRCTREGCGKRDAVRVIRAVLHGTHGRILLEWDQRRTSWVPVR